MNCREFLAGLGVMIAAPAHAVRLAGRVGKEMQPPMRLPLSRWIEMTLRLPEGVSALPGSVRLWPYQPGIADAISDPLIERVTLVKPVRVGFTTILTGAIGSYVVNEPSPILAMLPTEADARDYMVSDIEPIFEATPVLKGALGDAEEEGERNTLLSRRFAGGSLKIVDAKSAEAPPSQASPQLAFFLRPRPSVLDRSALLGGCPSGRSSLQTSSSQRVSRTGPQWRAFSPAPRTAGVDVLRTY